MNKPYWRMTSTEFQNTWFGFFLCIVMALALFGGLFYWVTWRLEKTAESASRLTGQNITPEDIQFNGNRIIIVK